MSPGIIGQAAGVFAVTNVDDILILALFFAQGAEHRHTTRNILAGQYLGFIGILAVAVAAAFGATFLSRLPRPAQVAADGRPGESFSAQLLGLDGPIPRIFGRCGSDLLADA